MAEEREGQGTAPVIPEAVEGGGAEKEQVHRDFQKEVAELGKISEAVATERLAIEEAEKRMERQLAKIREAQKKNVPVGPDGTENLGKSGVTWDDVMNLRTKNAEVREAQELQTKVVDRLAVKATRAGLTIPGQPVNLAKVPTDALAHLAEKDEDLRELRTRRQLAALSWWDSTTSTSGAEWVPTGFAREAVDYYYLDAPIPDLFQQVTIPEGVGDFSVPVETTQVMARLEDQQDTAGTVAGAFVNSNIAFQPLTAVAALSPKKHGLALGVSMEGVEDIVVDAVGRSRLNATRSMPRAATQAIINGQVANDTNLDDLPAASGFHSSHGYSNAGGDNGLRLHCVANTFTDAVGGPLTAVEILIARASMGNFGAREDELALITSGAGYLGLLQDPNVLTVEKMGTMATIVSGQLASVAGVPVLFTSEFPSQVDAAGINQDEDGSTNITGAILVNHRRWLFARKRAVEVTLLPHPGMDSMWVIARQRTHFVVAVQDEHSAHYLINVPY